VKAIARRLRRLEDQLRSADWKPTLLLVVSQAGQALALGRDACIQILRESGFLPTGPCGVVNFGKIPAGLDVLETERFLRENAVEICGFGSAASLTQERPGARRL